MSAAVAVFGIALLAALLYAHAPAYIAADDADVVRRQL